MKVIGIYPGRFQPAHRGHLGVYKRLKQISGTDTFIATTDKTPTPDSPLNFGEKQQIWVRHGVPSSNVVKVKNTYSPVEITQNFMPETTSAVYALGSKDVERFGSRKAKDETTGKEVWMKADGKTPGYFQPYKGNEHDMQPFEKHGYVMVITDIKIDGKPISGTNIRNILGGSKYTPEQKKKFFIWAMGWYDPSLYEIMVDVFSKAKAAESAEKTPLEVKPVPRTISKNALRKVVAEILDEYIEPQGGPDPKGSPGTSKSDDDYQQNKTVQQQKQDAVKAKQQAEREYKTLQTDLDWKKKSVIGLRKDQLPNKRKEIDQLNKAITGITPNPASAL